MTYIGSPVIFQFDKIAEGIEFGTSSQTIQNYQFCRITDDIYFLASSGLCVIRAAQVIQHLARNKTALYYMESIGAGARNVERNKFLSYDKVRNLLVTSYSRELAGAARITDQIIYSVDTGNFARASLSAEFAFNGFGFRDAAGLLLQSTAMYFDRNFRLVARPNTIGAVPDAALIETADISHLPERKSFVNQVRPVINHQGTTGSPMIQVGTKNKANQSISFSATVTVNNNGEAPQRASGRIHRYRAMMSVSASWSSMTGLEINVFPDGER